ncbi:hypothetical protein CNR22_23515 [Sphingobacteriaceae bacterium]|nr:hypothetical protein CNR22_23515 [Sphingobacteriaceae bacterium]
MKRINLLLSLTLLLFISCKKKDTLSTTPVAFIPDCTGTTPTYAATVGPLISSKCATSGCHANGSSNGPGALTTYSQVKNASATVRSSVINATMPKNNTLTAVEKNTIICWIDAGAINN